MSNKTNAFGLRPLRHRSGAPWNGATQKCYIGAAYATALYIGDPVTLATQLDEYDSTGHCQAIIKSAGTTGILVWGVITSFEPNPDDLTKVYNPLSTARYANVAVASDDLIFIIRGDGGGTPSTVFVGQNAVMIANTTGSTVTGLSGMMLDEGTTNAPTTTQAYPLHILGLHDREDNELGDNAIWEVLINTNDNATGRIVGVTGA